MVNLVDIMVNLAVIIVNLAGTILHLAGMMLNGCREAVYECFGRSRAELMMAGRVLLPKWSGMAQTDVLKMPALGRPFKLGMLYDVRSDKLVPGISLWDPDDIEKDLTSSPSAETYFAVLSEDRIEDKAFALDIDGSLKMSFLGDLINVGGSAKYLEERKQSSQIARVTLKYECTTKFEQLSMKHLGRGNVKDSSVFDDKTATHVVVGLVYGARAFLIFDDNISDKETHNDIHGALNVMVKSIPSFSIVGKGHLTLIENKKHKANNMHCMFRGDFPSQSNPTTFHEAVEMYHQLPDMLGDNYEKAVPVQVWLYPLSKLDSKAAQLVREISVGLVKQTEELFEEFQLAEQTCNDLTRSDKYEHFPDIKKSIAQFHSHLQKYVRTFKKDLVDILPKIRGGGMGENTLAQLLRDNKSGPFSNYCVTKWLDGKRFETKILEAYINVMKDTTLVTEQDELDHIVARENAIVCFHFRLNCSDDELITAMKDMLDSGSKRNRPKSGKHDEFDARRLFDDNVTNARTRNAIHLLSHISFPHYHDYRKVNTDVCFLSYRDDDPANEMSCSIEVYKDGRQIETNFIPPSAPSVPCESGVTCNSTTLTWRKPHYGAEFIERYRILYRRAADINADWTCIETTSHEETFTVPKLQSSTVYVFKIQGKCKVGCSPSSDGSADIKTESDVHEREEMERAIQDLQLEVANAVNEMHNLEKEKETLQGFENQIKDNKDFEYTVDEDVCVKVDLEPGTHVTNCNTCIVTCHCPCKIPQNDEKSRCSAMKDGNCTVCSQKCHWSEHYNATFRWERKTVKICKVYAETLKLYQVAEAEKEGRQIIIQKMEEKYARMKRSTLSLIKKLKDCIVKLRDIALMPNASSTTELIDNMIKNEQCEKKGGWEGRIKELEELRKLDDDEEH